MKTIFVVEDDRSIGDLIAYALRGEGYEVRGFEDAESLRETLGRGLPDLLLLDIMLPGQDGLSLLRGLRRDPHTRDMPVILLTARSAEYDKVVGLDSGADDYITKPFGVMEMLSRVRAVLRRAGGQTPGALLRVGAIEMDTVGHTVEAAGKPVVLTLKEFDLLRFLMERKGQAVSRDNLLIGVWGYSFEGETRTVDVHVGTLRQKLGACGRQIETLRGVGYRIGETT